MGCSKQDASGGLGPSVAPWRSWYWYLKDTDTPRCTSNQGAECPIDGIMELYLTDASGCDQKKYGASFAKIGYCCHSLTMIDKKLHWQELSSASAMGTDCPFLPVYQSWKSFFHSLPLCKLANFFGGRGSSGEFFSF